MVVPAYTAATADNRPPAESAETRERWEYQGLIHRMLRGLWRPDAEKRLKQFFNEETWEFLPQSVIAFNTFLALIGQTSTLYDGEVAIHIDGQPPTEADNQVLGTDLLWTQQQETLEFVRGMNDAFVLRSWDNDLGCVRYLTVSPDAIEARSDPKDPSQPNWVRHLRRQMVPGHGPDELWCRATWDLPNKTMKIEAWVSQIGARGAPLKGRWEDVTAVVEPDVAQLPGNWPLWTKPPLDPRAVPENHDFGDPIWPWTAYHRRIGNRLFEPFHGRELVEGTLDASVLWTYWLGGCRDVAFLQRWLMDAELGGKAQKGKLWAPANPLMVMLLKSVGQGKQGSAGAFPQPMDPEKFGLAIAAFMAAFALYAGLSPADTSIGNGGLSRVSGFAIEVSRDGKRKIERKMTKPMSLSEAHNLAYAARIANAYGGANLPTARSSYKVMYTETARTVAEVKAEVEEVTTRVEAGLMHPADGLRRFQPNLTRGQAEAEIVEIASFRAALARAGVAIGEPADGVDPAAGSAPAEAPAQDTALNGAQVTSLLETITAVAERRLPRDSAIPIIVRAYSVANEDAEAMLGEVGRTFFVEPEQTGNGNRPGADLDLDALAAAHPEIDLAQYRRKPTAPPTDQPEAEAA